MVERRRTGEEMQKGFVLACAPDTANDAREAAVSFPRRVSGRKPFIKCKTGMTSHSMYGGRVCVAIAGRRWKVQRNAWLFFLR